MSNSNKGHLVVAITYHKLGTFEFGCVTEVFALHRPEAGDPWYRFQACAIEAGPLQALGGINFQAPHGLDMLEEADTIVIPGWRDPDECPPADFLMKLNQAYMRGARICSICSGAFVLAWAGLLDGKSATTHWRLAEKLKRNFPKISVVPQSLYVDEGQILTSAGSAAGLDMMLHLVARDHGGPVANLVAKRLIMPPHRLGGQAQFIDSPALPDDMGRLGRLIDWVRAHLADPHTLDTLADRAAMSRRTLQRQFAEVTGLGPYEWLVQERIAAAKQLLESPHTPIEQVGERSGFGSPESFRRQFRKVAGVSPGSYRKTFLQTSHGERASGHPMMRP